MRNGKEQMDLGSRQQQGKEPWTEPLSGNQGSTGVYLACFEAFPCRLSGSIQPLQHPFQSRDGEGRSGDVVRYPADSGSLRSNRPRFAASHLRSGGLFSAPSCYRSLCRFATPLRATAPVSIWLSILLSSRSLPQRPCTPVRRAKHKGALA